MTIPDVPGRHDDPQTAALRATVSAQLPRALDDLRDLVAIPSVSSLPDHADDVARSAQAVAELFRGAGCPDVRIVAEGGKPAVIARFPGPDDAPRICLYAHHDVQPVGDPSLWSSEPFATQLRDGRLYGRGVGDDKAGIVGHLLALRALLAHGDLPVGVTVFVEGEEEIGSPSLGRLIETHHDALAADAYVILDASNWAPGEPSLTTTLRGLGELYVTVSTSDRALHSGIFGGAVPDALTSLCVLIATLYNEHGSVAVPGLGGTTAARLDYPEDRLIAETGKLDGVDWLGEGPMVERLWTKPALAVVALDATPVAQASNTLYPSATAKLSLRVPPGTDAQAAQEAVAEHLRRHAPYGVHVDIRYGEHGQPWQARLDGPIVAAVRDGIATAFGREAVESGTGGSIPLAAAFETEFPDSRVIVTGVLDPTSAMHAPNESVSVVDLERSALAEALFLAQLGASREARRDDVSPTGDPGPR